MGFERRGVYDLVSREWAEEQGLSILGTRWVDKRKGNRVRSRLCVQDFNFRKGKAGPDDLFAPTPPLVAARYTASRAATGPRFPRRLRRQLMALDFEKAFLNGDMERKVCIALPAEDARAEGGLKVGLLRKAMSAFARRRRFGRRSCGSSWASSGSKRALPSRACSTTQAVTWWWWRTWMISWCAAAATS